MNLKPQKLTSDKESEVQAIKKEPFLMGRADPLKSCGISGRGSDRGSVFSRYAL